MNYLHFRYFDLLNALRCFQQYFSQVVVTMDIMKM